MEFIVILCIIAAIIWYYAKKEMNKPEPGHLKQSPITVEITTSHNDSIPRLFEPTAENIRIMQALLFIAKADGQLRENECEVIAEYLKAAQPEHESTATNFISWCVRDIIKIEYIDYKKILNKMDKTQAENFLIWASRVVNTQDKAHPFEEVLIDNIKEYIADIGESTSEINLER